MFKQNSFSRSLANDMKMGAYYTDIGHCKRIGNLFEFPDEEVCVLESSIGNAEAVLAVTRKRDLPNIKVFGVELNPVTCKELEAEKKVDYLLNADFLNGVKISHNVFSFCFANPPYGVAQDEHKRLETLFVDKMANYITVDGILALVIPYYVFADEAFLKTFFKWFLPLSEFRFDDAVYAQFKQIVVIGIKRKSIGYLRSSFDEYLQRIGNVENLPYLPKADEDIPRLKVRSSSETKIEYFTTIEFDAAKASEKLHLSPLYGIMKDKIFVSKYYSTKLGRPPVPLKKDFLYLCGVSGGGQGLVGSEDNQDLHLQRGVVKTEVMEEMSEDGKEMIQRTFAKVSLNIIQNSGEISVLS